MADQDYIPSEDTKIPPFANTFTTYATANLLALGLVAGDVTPISTGSTALQTAINNADVAKQAYRQAIQAKIAARKTVVTAIRITARKVQSNPAVSPAQKAALGITPRTNARTKHKPITPQNVLAVANADGTNEIRWNRSGNVYGVVFMIEARTIADPVWKQVGAVTGVRFKHTDQTPGVAQSYRVLASRNGQISVPSQSAGVYGGVPEEAEQPLRMAA